jgi:hypothetical protein
VDQLTEIARQIHRSCTGIGQDIPSILVGNPFCLVTVVPVSDSLHSETQFNRVDGVRGYILETVLGTVPLAPLGKAAVPVSHQLMRTGPGDTFNLEGEVDMLKHTVVATGVQMLYQRHRVLGITVVADRCDLRDGFHRVGGGLNQSDIHGQFSSVK